MMNRIFGLAAAPDKFSAHGKDAKRGAVARLAARAANPRREMVL